MKSVHTMPKREPFQVLLPDAAICSLWKNKLTGWAARASRMYFSSSRNLINAVGFVAETTIRIYILESIPGRLFFSILYEV